MSLAEPRFALMIRIFRGPRHPGGWYEGAPTIVKVVWAVQPHSSSGNGIAKFLERNNRPETKPPQNLQARSGERTAVGRFFLQDRQSLLPVVISLSNARSPTTNPLMSLVRGSLTKGSKSASIFRLRLARPGTRRRCWHSRAAPNYLNPMSLCVLAFLCADLGHRLRLNRRRVILTRRP